MGRELQEPSDVLYRIKRGLSGYVSYLAACEMNESFSEYVLYEPILRILTARDYEVQCEVECPGVRQPPTGDKKRLDFVATGDVASFAMEVKWAKTSTPQIEHDIEKLEAYAKEKAPSRSFLCVFGTKSRIEKLNLKANGTRLQEQGKPIIAEFGRTRYGCRIFELAEQDKSSVCAGARR